MATGRDNGPRPVNINPYERSLLPTDPQFANLLMNWSHYRQRLVVFLGAGASVGARSKTGCEQEFVGARILRDLPECDEFGPGCNHALSFE